MARFISLWDQFDAIILRFSGEKPLTENMFSVANKILQFYCNKLIAVLPEFLFKMLAKWQRLTSCIWAVILVIQSAISIQLLGIRTLRSFQWKLLDQKSFQMKVEAFKWVPKQKAFWKLRENFTVKSASWTSSTEVYGSSATVGLLQ